MFDDHFYVWRIISAGYFAEHGCMRRKTKINVAVKAIKLDLIEDKDVVKRCRLEAAVIAGFDRPNIVRLFSHFEDQGALYIEMEFFEDISVLSYVLEQADTLFTEQQIGEWFAQIASALFYFHKHNLLHQNIKPSSVFLTSSLKQAKLGGYITPRPLNRVIESNEKPDRIKHLAPELSAIVNSETERVYGREADVWSLGVLLYEMATLTPPFEAGNEAQLFKKIAGSKPKPLCDTYSVEMRRLVIRLMGKVPDKRPTMQQVMMDTFVRRHIHKTFPETLL